MDAASPPTPKNCEYAQDLVDDQVDIQHPPVHTSSHDDHLEISLHALAGITTPQTMRVKGFFKKIPLTILIDSGSTHNFIDPQIARQDDYFVHPCSMFEVMIANGGTLTLQGEVLQFVYLYRIL